MWARRPVRALVGVAAVGAGLAIAGVLALAAWDDRRPPPLGARTRVVLGPPDAPGPEASAADASAVREVLSSDPALRRLRISIGAERIAASRIAPWGGKTYVATVPVGEPTHLDAAVPVLVGRSYGVDPPEVREARLVAEDVTALSVWVDLGRGAVVEIDVGRGRIVAFDWLGAPPPRTPPAD